MRCGNSAEPDLCLHCLSLFHIKCTAAVHLSMMTNFWVSCGSPTVLCATTQDCGLHDCRNDKNKIFTQGCCKTYKAFVRLMQELTLTHFAFKCPKNAARIQCNELAFYCTAAPRMPRTVRQLMKFAPLWHLPVARCSLATLKAQLTTALGLHVRQSCEHRTAALGLVKINLRYAILSAISRTAWCLR